MKSKKAKGAADWLHLLFRHHLPLESETAVFILVNVLDYTMTYWMLMHGFRESNPIANWFLAGWGAAKGLLLYKFALITTVVLICQIVYTKRPHTARLLLTFGSLGVFFVVVYSLMLYVNHGGTMLELELPEL
ncbi:DUF5658 family protein [Planctomicrobium piriforme]|uniref:DUF5658 family protein n=1 Tax=Planctomicrobium piriforme TaxID=1576369 RepID=UPI000B8325A8|nr:DUF5658 family protein [Planctomicrobium piriforme]